MTIAAEVLFLGLMMFCLEDEGCPLLPGDLPARAYMINATEEGCWCDGGGCSPCGGPGFSKHEPFLVFDADETKAKPHGLGSTVCPPGPLSASIKCWNLRGRSLCFDLGAVSGGLLTKPGRQPEDREPDALNSRAFDWVGSLSYFDFPDNPRFASMDELQPSAAGSCPTSVTQSRVVTLVDLPDHGVLEAEMIGPGGSPNGYALWAPEGIIQQDEPAMSALAGGVSWWADGLTHFKIFDCDEPDRFVEFTAPQSRAVIVNSPPKAFELGEAARVQRQRLVHFRMYHQLLETLPAEEELCPAPVDLSGCSTRVPIPLRWIGGQGLESESCPKVVAGASEPNADTALCPPSKFP